MKMYKKDISLSLSKLRFWQDIYHTATQKSQIYNLKNVNRRTKITASISNENIIKFQNIVTLYNFMCTFILNKNVRSIQHRVSRHAYSFIIDIQCESSDNKLIHIKNLKPK